MKPFTATFFLWIISILLYSQNNIQWKILDDNEGEYNFQSIFHVSEKGQKAVFTIPHNRLFRKTKHNIFVRNYNADMTSYTELGIPPESPQLVSIKGFRNYNVILGSMDDNNTENNAVYSKDNIIVITDNEMNPLITKSFSLHNQHNRFKNLPEIIISSDSNYLIIVNSELQNTQRLSLSYCPVIKYIDVYDKYLKHVWSDSIDSEIVLGRKLQVSNYNFNFYENQLIVTASYEDMFYYKNNAEIFVAVFDKPQSFKILMKKEFPYEGLSYRTLFSDSGKIIFSGYSFKCAALNSTNPKRILFYLSKDIKFPDNEPVYKYYKINRDFGKKYPNVKSSFKKNFVSPQRLFYKNNKLYYFNDWLVGTAYGSNTCEFGKIILISFDMEGNIEWIKDIDKSVNIIGLEDEPIQYGNVFLTENGLDIFYYDNIKNVYSNKLKPLRNGVKNLCLVNAKVSPNGDIIKTIIVNVGNVYVKPDLSMTKKINDNTYLFVGIGTTLTNKGNYSGFFRPGK